MSNRNSSSTNDDVSVRSNYSRAMAGPVHRHRWCFWCYWCFDYCNCQDWWTYYYNNIKDQCLLPVSEAFLGSAWWRVFLVFGNFILLFGNPIQVLILPKVLDPVMDVLYTSVLIAFLVDVVFRAVAVPGYFGMYWEKVMPSNSTGSYNYFNFVSCGEKGGCLGLGCWPHMGSFLFWCDLVSTLTLLWDISYTNPHHFQLVEINIHLKDTLLEFTNDSIHNINDNRPWEVDYGLMVTILKTARVVRFVRSQAVSNLIAKFNWYWPLQRVNALWYYLSCSTRRRRDEDDGADDEAHNNNNTSTNPNTTTTTTTTNGTTISTRSAGAHDSAHHHRPHNNNNSNNNNTELNNTSNNNNKASSKSNNNAAAAALSAAGVPRQSWNGLGLATLAAVKAQRLAREAEQEQAKTWSGKAKLQLRRMGLMAKEPTTEWKRQLAATKIQRAWRKAVARHQLDLNADNNFMDHEIILDRLGPVREEDDYGDNDDDDDDEFAGDHHHHHGTTESGNNNKTIKPKSASGGNGTTTNWKGNSSATTRSHRKNSGSHVSSYKKRLPRSIRKMSIAASGMDAAAAATARISQKLKYATSGETAAESQVGGAMRELTGQRVAIGILVSLLLTACFTYVEYDATRPATMAILHAQTTGTRLNDDDKDNRVETIPPPARWQQMALRAARQATIQDLYKFQLTNVNDQIVLQEDYSNELDEDDDLRARETLQITVHSQNFSDYPEYRTMTSVGMFAYRQERKNEAVVQLLSTIFILFLWGFGVTGFAGPVMVLVVLPIERMVRLLGMLMVDPLGYQSTSRYRRFVAEEDQLTKNTRWTKEVLKGMETSFLMSTILRIGSLMKVGFGSAGVEIIRKNLETKKGGDVNLQTSKGVTVSCIFLFCDIRQFTDATECLQEEVFVFTNRIAAVVHSHCHSFGGSANKNVGDAFLCSWLLDDPPPEDDGGFGGSDERLYAKSNQADKCLMCVVKIIMALHHDSYYIETMSEAPRQRLLAKLKKRPGPVVQMGCGLHAGKAVQGAIGSERKIDATYVSEAVEMSEFLESSTKKYGLKMLMSNAFYNLLHSNNRQRCRLVDQIILPGDDDGDDEGAMYERDDIVELYTFDMDVDALWKAPVPESHKAGGKDPMDGGSMMSDADSVTGVSERRRDGQKDRRGDLMKALSGAQRPAGSTRLGRKGRRMSLSARLASKQDVSSSGNSSNLAGSRVSVGLDGSVHEGPSGGVGSVDHANNSSAFKVPDGKEAPTEFRKPELILPTGPALYTPAIWRTETMFRIRKKYLDGLFFHNYSQGLQSFYHREWDRATQSFKAILDTFEDGPSRYFLNQIEKNGGKPPPNFKPYGTA